MTSPRDTFVHAVVCHVLPDVLLHVVVTGDDGHRDADEEDEVGDEVLDQVVRFGGGR